MAMLRKYFHKEDVNQFQRAAPKAGAVLDIPLICCWRSSEHRCVGLDPGQVPKRWYQQESESGFLFTAVEEWTPWTHRQQARKVFIKQKQIAPRAAGRGEKIPPPHSCKSSTFCDKISLPCISENHLLWMVDSVMSAVKNHNSLTRMVLWYAFLFQLQVYFYEREMWGWLRRNVSGKQWWHFGSSELPIYQTLKAIQRWVINGLCPGGVLV